MADLATARPAPVELSPQGIGMLHALPLGLALLDFDGHCMMTNDAFAETVGGSCQPNTGGLVALAVEADRERLRAAIGMVLTGSPEPQECRIRLALRPDENVALTLAAAPPGWGFGVLVAVRDIREQLRLEQQVAQVTKMQAVGQLAGGIAHDFNNILTAVLGLCDELLARHSPEDSDYDDIDQIRQNGNRAADLVRQLLAFARQQTLRPQLLDIEHVIAGVRPLLLRLLGHGVDLVISPAATALPLVRVDPGQLEQVIVNLAVNARDAMPGGGTLTIRSHNVAAVDVAGLGHRIMPAADYVAIVVTDTGSGIAPEISAKIFEPFFTTKPVGQGTGLGLSTVYGIVKQTGGFIFVNSAPGWTSFTVYLPSAGARPARLAEPPAVPDKAMPLHGTVLLVEDDRAVRLVVARALTGHGLTVLTAVDAMSGLGLIERERTRIDLLISDVVMPGMDGVALVDAARREISDLPAILMSGYAEPPQRRALDGTGVRFLAKPFAISDLVAAVRLALVHSAAG